MAWKEFSELSKADQQHEDVRQKMIICQSCLDRATTMVMGLGSTGLDKFTLQTIKQRVEETASELVDWVYEKANEYQDQDEEPGGKPDTTASDIPKSPDGIHRQLPIPTPIQLKVLDTICKKVKAVGKEQQQKVYTKVLQWAQEKYGQRVYPTKPVSVDNFVKWYTN